MSGPSLKWGPVIFSCNTHSCSLVFSVFGGASHIGVFGPCNLPGCLPSWLVSWASAFFCGLFYPKQDFQLSLARAHFHSRVGKRSSTSKQKIHRSLDCPCPGLQTYSKPYAQRGDGLQTYRAPLDALSLRWMSSDTLTGKKT
jgi:hypothetical protein